MNESIKLRKPVRGNEFINGKKTTWIKRVKSVKKTMTHKRANDYHSTINRKRSIESYVGTAALVIERLNQKLGVGNTDHPAHAPNLASQSI